MRADRRALARAEALLRAACGDRVRVGFPLAPLTTFRIGGPAALYLEPTSMGDLAAASRAVRETGLPYVVLGKGSNVLVADEGFLVHPDKTRVLRKGGRQRVTGLVVNGDLKPRVPRALRRQLRAALHNFQKGKGLHDGETADQLAGYAAFVYMTDPELGRQLLEGFLADE